MDGLPVFMGKVPEYEVLAGRMHVTLDGFEIVMPLAVFECGARRAQDAIAKWKATERGKVVEFPGHG